MPMAGRVERVWQWLHRWALWWLLAMLFFFGYDIFYDALSDGADFHVFMEALTFFSVTAVLVVEWRRNNWLSLSLEEASQHSQRLSGQFSDYVRTSFSGWSLSRSEQEVAWLLLKGFSFAEIATLRGVQEKTVRQQATGIYAKSGCKNRNEFLAHFIQDLLEAEHLTTEAVAADPVVPPTAPATSAEATVAADQGGPTSASGRAPE